MLTHLRIRGFKSLRDIELPLPPLTVLFGPNAVGKSNLLDALLVLSRVATERTLAEALAGPVRGFPNELFTFPPGGLPELLGQELAEFSLESDFQPTGNGRRVDPMRYRVAVAIHPRSGSLTVADEYLARLELRRAVPKGTPPIEVVGSRIHVRRKSRGRPREEPLGLNHTIVSDPRLAAPEYTMTERARNELSKIRTYYLDPRSAMRQAVPPREVEDIGSRGQDLASYLYRLKNSHPNHFGAVIRTLRTIIPSIDSLSVELDEKRGTLEIQIVQDNVTYSSRIISEGTLRVLALAAIAVNPWPGALVAFEEPENGVHPRRLDLVARLLTSLAMEGQQQVVVTTHSPLFCQRILDLKRNQNEERIELIVLKRDAGGTHCAPFSSIGPLWDDKDLREAFASHSEDGWFEGLALRGLIDG